MFRKKRTMSKFFGNEKPCAFLYASYIQFREVVTNILRLI